jgi:hypothetical protein
VIIILPLYESWETIWFILKGIFTNEIFYEKIDDISTRVRLIMKSMPEAERLYYQEKENLKKEEAADNAIQKEPENDKPIQ